VESVRVDELPAQPIATGAVVRRAAPRLVRDGFGPLAIFFAGWKLIGLTAGIGMAVLFGVAVFTHERRQGRPAMIVRVALVLVAIRASVGLTSGSARVYLAQEIALDTLLGLTVLGLLARGRPLAAVFAREMHRLDAAYLATIRADRRKYHQTFRALIEDGQRKGDFSPVASADTVTLMVFGMINQLPSWYSPAGPKTSTELAAEVTEFVLAALRPQ